MMRRPFIFIALLAALLFGCVSGPKPVSPNTAQFNKTNRLTNTVSPLCHRMVLTFDHQGLVSTITDPSNQLTSLYYDSKGRLTNGIREGQAEHLDVEVNGIAGQISLY
jgi:YD repeat-containing protein